MSELPRSGTLQVDKIVDDKSIEDQTSGGLEHESQNVKVSLLPSDVESKSSTAIPKLDNDGVKEICNVQGVKVEEKNVHRETTGQDKMTRGETEIDHFHVSDWDDTANIPTIHFTLLIEMLLPKHLISRSKERELHLVEYMNKFIQTNYGKNPNIKCISVGSAAESYMIPSLLTKPKDSEPTGVLYSDIDVLAEWNFVPIKELGESLTQNFRIETENTHPGYARIFIAYPEKLKDADPAFSIELNGKFYLSADKPRQDMHENAETEISGKIFSEVKGPAVAIEDSTPLTQTLLDKNTAYQSRQELVTAIPCLWLSVANEWRTRKRNNGWLTPSVIDAAVKQGGHLVPVAHKQSENPNVEWRISFATSEVLLANTAVTAEQRQCYVYFKLLRQKIMKDYNLISSYHCKTVFLYSCERLPVDVWKKNAGACVLFMLDLLRRFVSNKFLPSYFIPSNNLIDHFSAQDFEMAENLIQQLQVDPIEPILNFTDTYIIAEQSVLVPFRTIISPVLEDFMKFKMHRNIALSLDSFIKSLVLLISVYLEENKTSETVAYLFDLFKFFSQYFPQENIQAFMNCALANCKLTMQLVQVFQKILPHSKEYPSVASLRGHLANLYHCAAFNFSPGTDGRLDMLTKSETLFNTILNEDGPYTPSTIDFACLLMANEKHEEACCILRDFIAGENCVYSKQNKYSKITYTVLGKDLRNAFRDIFKNPTILSIPSVSLAYYMQLQCMRRRSSEEDSNISVVIEDFKHHCDSFKPVNSWSYFLLGISLMEFIRFEQAKAAFKQTLTNSKTHAIASTKIHICHVQNLLKMNKTRDAVNYLINTAKTCYGGVPVIAFLDFIAVNTSSPQYAVDLYQEMTSHSSDYPDVLNIRGNMACMYHSSAYLHQEDSEEFVTCIVQAETLFKTVMVTGEGKVKLALKIDYCGLLMSQKKWHDVEKILCEALEQDSDSEDTNGYGALEYNSVDENIQNEIYLHGSFAAKSLAFAFYFLMKSRVHLKSPADKKDEIMTKFECFCEKEKNERAYALLGYIFMSLQSFDKAEITFCKAVIISRDYTAAKQNIAICQTKCKQLGISTSSLNNLKFMPCMYPELLGDYTYDIEKMVEQRKANRSQKISMVQNESNQSDENTDVEGKVNQSQDKVMGQADRLHEVNLKSQSNQT